MYSFKDNNVEMLFKLLMKGGHIKLLEPQRPEEAGKTNNPKYCAYNRMVGHPSMSCYILKDQIQTLVDADILKVRPE